MALVTSFRQIQRNVDGFSLRVNFEDWIRDVPLPPQTSLVGFGEQHDLFIYPEWRFAFQTDCTDEVWSGTFRVALSLTEVVAWFQTELMKLGWAAIPEKTFIESDWASLKFYFPETTMRVSVSLRWWEDLKDTQMTIWRVTKHPLPSAVESIPDSQLALPIAEEAIR